VGDVGYLRQCPVFDLSDAFLSEDYPIQKFTVVLEDDYVIFNF